MASSGNIGNNNLKIIPVATLSKSSGDRGISSTSGSWGAPLNMAARTGKWYIEYYVNNGSSGRNVMVVPTNSKNTIREITILVLLVITLSF